MDKCRNCGTELSPINRAPCPKCGGTSRVLELSASDGARFHESSRVRQKRKGYDEFMVESIQGWFPAGDSKLKNGVNKVRIIDKEKNEYHETVKDARTGEVIRDIHEPLSQHKQQTSQPPKNVKKPQANH